MIEACLMVNSGSSRRLRLLKETQPTTTIRMVMTQVMTLLRIDNSAIFIG